MVISKDFFYGIEDSFDPDYLRNIHDINQIMESYEVRISQNNILTEFGIFTEAQEELFLESAVDTVRKLGEKILEMIEKLKQFVSDCAANLREVTMKRQTLGNDMIRIEANNPELAGKIKVAIRTGDINFSTMRGISDYYKEIDKIVDEIEQNKIDPKSFRGKLERAKKRLVANKETITTISCVIGILSTVTTLSLNWNHHKHVVAKENGEIDELSKQSMLVLDRTKKLAKKLQSLPPEKRPVTPMGFYATIVAEVDKETRLQISRRETLIANLAGRLDTAIKKAYEILKIQSGYSAKIENRLR